MDAIQPKINIGIVGHVDHGKTTITKNLSGNWTDKHSEEKKRRITIKLGYTNFSIYKDNKDNYSTENIGEFVNTYSIVDSPGHESFMATMICGSSIMDYALLVVDAFEKFPMPQTIEHLKILENQNCKNIIVVQNKVDSISKEDAKKNFLEIKEFLSNTKFNDAKIIPISAFYKANMSNLLKYISSEFIPLSLVEKEKPEFTIIKSFDVNKPGTDYKNIVGGILGVSIRKGSLKIGDEISISPGIKTTKNGISKYENITTKITGIKTDKTNLEKADSGGCVALMCDIDSFLTKNDSLVGQVGFSLEDKKEILYEVCGDVKLFDNASKMVFKGEILMMIVNSFTTIGIVSNIEKNSLKIKLKRPIVKLNENTCIIFRQDSNKKWGVIGSIHIK